MSAGEDKPFGGLLDHEDRLNKIESRLDGIMKVLELMADDLNNIKKEDGSNERR